MKSFKLGHSGGVKELKAFIVRRKSGFWPFDNGSRIRWEQPNSNIEQKEVSRIPECHLRKEYLFLV